MPIIYQHNINEHTKLAVWHITEPEAFFLKRVPLKKEVSHPHKRLQHLAGRYLLPALFSDFPLEEILVADTRKPFLENEQYHFSISHCGNYAAAIVSSVNRVGVDIEAITPRIEKIQHKFVGDAEWALALSLAGAPGAAHHHPTANLLTLLWSAKEAIYKWYGSGQLDFKAHMPLSGVPSADAQGFITLPFSLYGNGIVPLIVQAVFMNESVLSWVLT